MSEFKVQMPKLGESVQEATITKWFVKEGDKIEEDGAMFEVATEKVDSEIPSPVDGVISKIFYNENDLVAVGEIVAIIQVEGEDETMAQEADASQEEKGPKEPEKAAASESSELQADSAKKAGAGRKTGRFYSPLVMNMAKKENISFEELENIPGSGENGRVQKKDILQYLEANKQGKSVVPAGKETIAKDMLKEQATGAAGKVIEMDRVRKIIAERMVDFEKDFCPCHVGR